MPTNDTREDALAFLSSHTLGVLATLSPEGAPRSRTMYYASDGTFALYVLTLLGTRKTADLAHDARASFVVSDENAPKTLQIEGTVSDLTETTEIDAPTVRALLETLLARGERFAPVTRLDANAMRFYKLTPTWVRWGNFTEGQGTDEVLSELPA